MPACRQMSLTGTPASACLRIETIWVSVKRDFFMEPPGWGKHARKFYLWGVCGSGKLTIHFGHGRPRFVASRTTILPGRPCASFPSVGRRTKKKTPARGRRPGPTSPEKSVRDVDVFGLLQEQGADHEGHQRDDDR